MDDNDNLSTGKEGEDLLRNTIDSSMDMIQVFRAVRDERNEIVDFIWVLINKTSEKIYGNVVGKSLLTLNPGVIEEGIFDTFKQVVETGIPDQSERHYVHEQFNGWFLQYTVKQEDGVTTTTRDITAARKAEQNIRESEAFLQALIDSSLDVIQVFEAVRDNDSRIVDFRWKMQNSNGARQNGDVIGESLLKINPGIVAAGIYKRMVQVTETGVPSEQEQHYSYEQFENAWFYQALAKQGDGVMMTTRNITAQKRAEQEVLRLKDELAQRMTDKYLSIFNSIDEGFCIFELLFDDNGIAKDYLFVEVNPAFEKQTGLTDVVGRTGYSVTSSIEPYWLEMYSKVLQTGEPVRFENYHKGTNRWYHVYASRVGSAGSHLVAIVFDDITDRKRQAAQQSILAEISKDLVELEDITAAYEILGEKIARHFDVSWCNFLELATDSESAVSSYGWNATGVPSLKGTYNMVDHWTAEQAESLAAGEVFVSCDAENDPRVYGSALAALGIRSFVSVPLARNGQFNFLHSIMDTKPRQWRADEVELIQELVCRIWTRLERARAEDALRNSDKKYAAAFDSMDQGFCLLEWLQGQNGGKDNLRFLEVNPAFTGKTGIADLVGKTVEELLPSFNPYWLSAYTHVTQPGESVQMEIYLKDADRWYSVYFSHIGPANSCQMAVLFTDISERKQQESRRDFLLKLSDALHPLTDATAIQEHAARIIGKQLQVARSFYFTVEQVDDGFTHIVLKDYYAHKDMPSLVGTHQHGSYTKSMYAPLADGETLVIPDITKLLQKTPALINHYLDLGIRSLVYVPLIKNGQYVAAFAVTDNEERNWTWDEIDLVKETAHRTWAAVERARAETSLRLSESLLNGQKEAFQAAMDGRSLAASLEPLLNTVQGQTGGKARAAFFMIPPGGEGLHLVAGMTEEYARDVNGCKVGPESLTCGLSMYTGQPVITEDVEKDPSWEPWRKVARAHHYRSCWSFPISTHGGPVLGTFSMYFAEPCLPQSKEMHLAEIISHAAAIIISRHTQLAERTLAEVSLRNSEQQLKELVRLRDEFIGVASHELKTPVTSMKVYAEIVQERLNESGDRDESNLVSQLNMQIDRLTALINHLLDTTSISEGRLKLVFEKTDLNLLIRERLAELSRTSNHTFDIQTAELPQVLCDRERIGQVLTNLASNAIKYSKKGTKITVKTEAGNDGVRVSVQDEGYGIPVADMKNIFQRFFRVSVNNMDTFPGMGLGLYITSQIIEAHHGTIAVESHLGKGSTFSFIIPYDCET